MEGKSRSQTVLPNCLPQCHIFCGGNLAAQRAGCHPAPALSPMEAQPELPVGHLAWLRLEGPCPPGSGESSRTHWCRARRVRGLSSGKTLRGGVMDWVMGLPSVISCPRPVVPQPARVHDFAQSYPPLTYRVIQATSLTPRPSVSTHGQ